MFEVLIFLFHLTEGKRKIKVDIHLFPPCCSKNGHIKWFIGG